MKRLRLAVVIVGGIILLSVLALLAYFILSRTWLEQRVFKDNSPAVAQANAEVQKILPASSETEVETDCSYNFKSKKTSCYTTKELVSKEQQGDVQAQLLAFNQVMNGIGWSSEGNEILFEQYKQIFIDPMRNQGWRSLTEFSQLRYSKDFEGNKVIATVEVSTSPNVIKESYYGQAHSDARKAVAAERYYLHTNLISNQNFQGNKY